MAFVTSPWSLIPLRAGLDRQSCVCMKAKQGTSGARKKSKRASRSKTSGVGFGSTNVVNNDKKNKSDNDSLVVREEATGAEGDATPHRAAVSAKRRLLDPQVGIKISDVSETDVGVSEEEAFSLRFHWKISDDEIIEKLEIARQNNLLEKTIIANRHAITERLLYRFTSAILQVEGSEDAENRKEESENMRELRKRIIAICWGLDMPFKTAILKAEERLMHVLQSANVKMEVLKTAGSSQLDVNAFWIVIYAAISAWEEQGKENEALVNIDVQEALKIAADACRTDSRISKILSPGLRVVEGVLNSADPNAQSALLESIPDDIVVEIGTMTEQIRLLPTNAYGALRQRMQTILDYLLSNSYGIPPATLNPLRFKLQEITRGSKIVSISKGSSRETQM